MPDWPRPSMADNYWEVVALTVVRLMRNAYEPVQKERLSIKLGLGESWVCAVMALKSGGSRLTAKPKRPVPELRDAESVGPLFTFTPSLAAKSQRK